MTASSKALLVSPRRSRRRHRVGAWLHSEAGLHVRVIRTNERSATATGRSTLPPDAVNYDRSLPGNVPRARSHPGPAVERGLHRRARGLPRGIVKTAATSLSKEAVMSESSSLVGAGAICAGGASVRRLSMRGWPLRTSLRLQPTRWPRRSDATFPSCRAMANGTKLTP